MSAHALQDLKTQLMVRHDVLSQSLKRTGNGNAIGYFKKQLDEVEREIMKINYKIAELVLD